MTFIGKLAELTVSAIRYEVSDRKDEDLSQLSGV